MKSAAAIVAYRNRAIAKKEKRFLWNFYTHAAAITSVQPIGLHTL
jgi:hypothetical protein